MKVFKDTKAVSPVIGVMLMLVVTVILAAAVSSTSTGMMKSSEAAPNGVFSIEIAKDASGSMGGNDYMQIKLITGDSIPTKDLKLMTINPQANGTNIMEVLPGAHNSHRTNYLGNRTYGTMPYYNNMAQGYFGIASKDFGNFTLRPGMALTADNYGYDTDRATWNPERGAYEGDATERTGMQAMFADWESVKQGDTLTVKIIHTPTQKVIFQSNVVVK